MGALICGKVSAKKLSFTVVVTALVFIYTFVYSEFGRILESKRSELVTSTAMSFSTGPFLRLDEIGDLKRRSRQSRRLLISGMETRHEYKSTTQSFAANIRDLDARRVGRSVVVSKRNRRFVANNQCSNKDISIIQNEETNAGIPRYVVQIVNTCISDCAPTDIHVFCGWFASSPLVNPNYFKRLAYNDCLVNGGRPLAPGSVIQFQYANTFMYPMRFRSANFC
ncbi:protein MpTPD1 [Marchantia polymorpha subsp. ruderalis]